MFVSSASLNTQENLTRKMGPPVGFGPASHFAGDTITWSSMLWSHGWGESFTVKQGSIYLQTPPNQMLGSPPGVDAGLNPAGGHIFFIFSYVQSGRWNKHRVFKQKKKECLLKYRYPLWSNQKFEQIKSIL